jgi:hypothetical protein
MMEMNYDWDWLVPQPYTTSILPPDVPRPFKPLPFNMLEHVVGWSRREIGYNRWGPGYYELQWGAYVTFQGPIKVKIVRWDDVYSNIIHDEQIVTIIDKGNIPRDWGEATYIFAYEDLAP